MADQKFDHAQAQEIIRFQISYNKRKVKSTWAIGIVIALMFFLEEYFGGSQNVVVLVRMGANVSNRVLNGEYYRLVSSVFLHAGLMHVFFNTYVLFALGGFFNRILGEAKYLTVFFVSGIFGSLASVFLGKSTVSVGASGAIWGLFGVSLALALFKTSLMPEAIRLKLRRVTLINLVINLGISFLPMIDFWAHIGGGIGGFLVSLLIIFRPKSKILYRLSEFGFQMAALILAIVYATGISTAIFVYKPWVNQIESELKTVALKKVPFLINVPINLKETIGEKNTPISAYYIFGDPKIDRLVIEAHFFHQSILGQKADKNWLSKQRQELIDEQALPSSVKKTIHFVEKHEGVLYYQQFPKNSDVAIHNYVITKNGYAIKIGLVVSKKSSQTEVDKLADKIIQGIRTKKP